MDIQHSVEISQDEDLRDELIMPTINFDDDKDNLLFGATPTYSNLGFVYDSNGKSSEDKNQIVNSFQ